MEKSSRRIGFAFFLNLLFAMIELVGGIYTNSVSITSDAIHDFGDSLSLGVAWLLEKKSTKRGDSRYSYGYRRFSLLGSVFISVVILTGSVFIVIESLERLADPREVNAAGMILLSFLGIIVNGAAALRLKGDKSYASRAVMLHMMEDTLGWIAVLAGSIIMIFTGLSVIDPILSLTVTAWILYNVVKNLSSTLKIMLQEVPQDVDADLLEKEIALLDYVDSVHDLHIWSLDGEKHILTIHVVLNENHPLSEVSFFKEKIRKIAEERGIFHTTIEFENKNEACHCGYKDLC